MKRGDVYEYTLGNRLVRIAIVSADPYNPRRATFALILGRDTPPPASVGTVTTTPADPTLGTLDLTRLRVLTPDAVRTRLGRLSPDTLRRAETALRTYLGL